MKRIIILLIFFLVAIHGNAQEINKNYAEAFKLIEVWLEAQKDFENIPSIAAMVVDDQNILWTGAFGKTNLEQNRSANTSTICSICSITKSFTAVAIMKLIDEGKLNLDDKVKDILPFFEVNQKFPEGGAITIRSLLSHASGLPGNTEHSYFTAPNFSFPTQTEFRSVFRDLKTESEVGTDVSYSNIGYALLGEIVEKVSGVSFEAYLEKEVLSPLKMSETYIGTSTIQDDKRKAIGYTALNRNRTRNRVSTFDPKAMNPAMGLWTSIYDLAKYASWQFRLIDASKTEILKPSTLKRMHTVQSRSKNGYSNWGLGFEVIKGSNGDDWVSHGGTCPGFVSLLQLNLTTKMGYAIMINANRSSTFKYLNGMKQILSKVRPIEENKNRVNLKDYTGYYNMNPWNSEVYISSWGEDLVMLQLPENSPKYGMRFFKHIKDDTFRQIIDNGELGDEYVFERDQNGKVYRYQDRGNYKNRIIR